MAVEELMTMGPPLGVEELMRMGPPLAVEELMTCCGAAVL